MKKFVFVALAAFAISASISTSAYAGKNCGISCDQPTGVGRGNPVPVWEVAYCVVGNPGSYKKVDCKSRKALHRTPTGNMGVCFIGTDGKPHWDYQWVVHVGRDFINRKLAGRWQPDWQE